MDLLKLPAMNMIFDAIMPAESIKILPTTPNMLGRYKKDVPVNYGHSTTGTGNFNLSVSKKKVTNKANKEGFIESDPQDILDAELKKERESGTTYGEDLKDEDFLGDILDPQELLDSETEEEETDEDPYAKFAGDEEEALKDSSESDLMQLMDIIVGSGD